jgi:hypothetical protein
MEVVTVVHQIRLLNNVSFFIRPWTITLLTFFFIVEAQQVAEKLKAQKDALSALRKKRALQKANQNAGIENATEDVYEPRPNPLVGFFF